jgi:hypothetical protein
MIEAYQLMKHNLVFLLVDNKSTPVTVLEILRDGLVVFDKTINNTKLVKFEEVHPIPLNIGIMLNMLKMSMSVLSDNKPSVFNKKEETFYSYILDDDNDVLIITDPETDNCTVSIKLGNNTDKAIEVKGNVIKSVHQLQNFITVVIGKSLVF